MTHPLLGNKPSRRFAIYRTDFPGIFRFDGELFMEYYNADENRTVFLPIDPKTAEPFLEAKLPQPKETRVR